MVKPTSKLQKIRTARQALGLNVRSLATKVGVSRQAISAYENGKYPPRESIWNKLKKVLGLSGKVEEYYGRLSRKGPPRMYLGKSCEIKGCGRPAVSKGMCRKHYQWVRYHKLYNGKDIRTAKA